MKNALCLLLLVVSCAGAQTAPESSFPKDLKIITRKDWGASPPVSKMTEHKPEYITIHHTGTKQNPGRTIEDKLSGLQKYSQRETTLASGKTKPAWPDVPYHFYIAIDGKLAEGRDLNFVGDTNTEYDPTGHLLIVLEGNFQDEKPSDAQMKTTQELVQYLAKRFKVPVSKIGSHKEYAQTSCPGENLQKLLPGLRDGVKEPEPTKPSEKVPKI